MAEILYLMPGNAMDAAEMARREALANAFLTRPDKHRVSMRAVGYGVDAIECSIEAEFSVEGLIKYALAHRGEYDALIIGCADDPGLFSLRETLSVPVVGPMESAVALSALLGHSFTLITTEKSAIPECKTLFRKYGVLNRCAAIQSMNQSVAELQNGSGSKESRRELLARVNEAVALGADCGADCAVLGCMSMAFALLDEGLANAPIPVINPAKAAVKTAEALLDLGLRHSDQGYPKPDMAPILEVLNQ